LTSRTVTAGPKVPPALPSKSKQIAELKRMLKRDKKAAVTEARLAAL
jgi:hypothetical protein